MKKLFARARRKPLIALAIVVAALVFLTGGTLAATEYTSRPAFCSSCHEMGPYYGAWDAGPHAGVSCISCHVDPGIKAQIPHKVEALREVYVHFTSNPTFPQSETAAIPDARCITCHEGPIASDKPGFDHDEHRQGRTCVDCHSEVGHKVSSQALAEAGILNVEGMRARKELQVASVGQGAANVSGHPSVTCTDCHDLAATGCFTCHARDAASHPQPATVSTTATADPASCVSCHSAVTWAFSHPAARADCTQCHVRPEPHDTGVCVTCHTTGAEWKFSHPASKDCASCHDAPAKHYPGTCSACHTPTKAFAATTFTHPGPGATCTSCHARPASHSAKSCATCHATGVSWAFRHPSSKDCAACHRKPSNHYAGTCSACHKPTQPFSSAKFTHPGSGATCTSCHKRPAGHSTAACASCHATGVSWAFRHPTSKTCSSCHKAPSNHYGTSCSSCHTPTKAWSSASFSHPSVPGGEHTYRSFSCVSCHPSSYSSVNCTSCHEREDDD